MNYCTPQSLVAYWKLCQEPRAVDDHAESLQGTTHYHLGYLICDFGSRCLNVRPVHGTKQTRKLLQFQDRVTRR